MIITVGKHDQHLVRINGTGRLTVRNRRFLRKYELRTPTIKDDTELPRINSQDLRQPKRMVHWDPPSQDQASPDQQAISPYAGQGRTDERVTTESVSGDMIGEQETSVPDNDAPTVQDSQPESPPSSQGHDQEIQPSKDDT